VRQHSTYAITLPPSSTSSTPPRRSSRPRSRHLIMRRAGLTRRLVVAGLAVIATAPLSTDAGLTSRAPVALAGSPTLKYYGAHSPTAEAQSWNEQSSRETEAMPTVLNPSTFAMCTRALYLWLVFTPVKPQLPHFTTAAMSMQRQRSTFPSTRSYPPSQ
jgi:hypothetical protein